MSRWQYFYIYFIDLLITSQPPIEIKIEIDLWTFFIEMAYGLFHITIQNITKKLGVSTYDALVNHLICFTLSLIAKL
jgi:hypothetical protein